jgi:hypothetical protein
LVTGSNELVDGQSRKLGHINGGRWGFEKHIGELKFARGEYGGLSGNGSRNSGDYTELVVINQGVRVISVILKQCNALDLGIMSKLADHPRLNSKYVALDFMCKFGFDHDAW